MGRLTTAGSALALSFANVRLGYWWDRGGKVLKTDQSDQPDTNGLDPGATSLSVNQSAGAKNRVEGSFLTKVAPTFGYLFNEMQARFPLNEKKIYVSDAGHSENTGAMALLDKGCRTVLVCDNGADPNYELADLETFIRTARIDKNFTIREASRSETIGFCGQHYRSTQNCFFIMQSNWRDTIGTPGGSAFALLLRARHIADSVKAGEEKDKEPTWIVWLIPRIVRRQII